MGVGNNIWDFLTGLGRFGDFHPDIIFDIIKTRPLANDSGQFPAFDIIYTRIFNSNKNYLIISNLLLGIFIPLTLLYKLLAEQFPKGKAFLAICIIVFGYPFLFTFFRANPILGSAMWGIFGVFSFI